MHKEEASALFKVLSEPYCVKLTKVLYKHEKLSLEELLKISEKDNMVLANYLVPLIKSNLVLKEVIDHVNYYACNKTLLKELLGFFDQECKCMK